MQPFLTKISPLKYQNIIKALHCFYRIYLHADNYVAFLKRILTSKPNFFFKKKNRLFIFIYSRDASSAIAPSIPKAYSRWGWARPKAGARNSQGSLTWMQSPALEPQAFAASRMHYHEDGSSGRDGT